MAAEITDMTWTHRENSWVLLKHNASTHMFNLLLKWERKSSNIHLKCFFFSLERRCDAGGRTRGWQAGKREKERGLNDIETTWERMIGGGRRERRARHQWTQTNRVCVFVCQRWRGEFRGSSVPPWRAAAATTNQLNRKKIEKMRSEQNPQRRGGKKND